jgi:hypothetical protein
MADIYPVSRVLLKELRGKSPDSNKLGIITSSGFKMQAPAVI